MAINMCACLGPRFGECHMEAAKLPRSQEYKEYYSTENVEKREQELTAVLSKAFGWSNLKGKS